MGEVFPFLLFFEHAVEQYFLTFASSNECYTSNAGGQAKPFTSSYSIGVFQDAPAAWHYLYDIT